MNSYTITREGRLIEHCKEYEECPESERPLYGTPEWNRPLGHLRDMLRVKPGSEHDVDTNYHGWLQFYGDYHADESRMVEPQTGRDQLHPEPGEWLEYRAKFTDGKIVEVTRVTLTSEANGDMPDIQP